MTRPRNSPPSEDEFVVVDASGNHLRDLRSLAENILATCNRMATSTEASATVCGEDFGERQTLEQATQTECVEEAEVTTTCFDQQNLEYETLKLKLKEVVGMNVGWQRLYEQQTKRIAELMEQIEQQRQTIASSSKSSEAVTAATLLPELNADACSAGVGTFDDEDTESLKLRNSQLESENTELKARICNLETQLSSAQDIIGQLEQAVDRLSCNLEAVAMEKQSFIDMLQAQILVYREDFESERLDRERAQGKLDELKTELECLRQRMFPGGRMPAAAVPQPARFVPAPQHRTPNVCANPGDYEMAGMPIEVHHRNVSYNYNNYGLFMHGRDEPDCDSASKMTDAAVRSDSATDAEAVSDKTSDDNETTAAIQNSGLYQVDSAPEDVLRCPSCRRTFTMDQHVDLMDHMETCEL